MLSESAKREIDSLSEVELRLEINKKNRSRFQRDNYAYAQTRLIMLEQQAQKEGLQQDIILKEEELSIAREANRLSHKANNLSKLAIAISIIAALIAILRH
jgi:hypothetical protein